MSCCSQHWFTLLMLVMCSFCFFKQKTAYEMRISDWSSDVCASDLAMLRGMGRGLLVTELMGQGVNNITGDYSRGAAGFWVEDGAISHAVNGITIAGNLKTMFRDIEAVGSDVDPRSHIH